MMKMSIKKASYSRKQIAQLIPLASKGCLRIRQIQDQDCEEEVEDICSTSSEGNQDLYNEEEFESDNDSNNIIYGFSTDCDDQ
jgi:hypothetical protein